MNPQTHQQSMQQALRLYQSNQLQDAKSLLLQITSKVKNDPNAWHILGAVQRRCGELDAGKKSLNRSLKLNRQQPDVWNTLGNLNRTSGNNKEALSCYQSALKLAPNHVDARNNKGLILNSTKRWKEAETNFTKALKNNPEDQTALAGLGDSLRGQKKYTEALAVYDRVLLANPHNVIVLNNKSIILKLQGRWAEAVSCAQLALDEAPNSSEVKHNLASALSGNRQEDEAVSLYQKIIEQSPQDASAHRYLNQILWTQGSDKFLQSYSLGKQARPDDLELRRSYAGQLMQAERFEEAEREIQSAIQMAPDNPALRLISAKIFKELKKFDDALTDLHHARKQNASNVSVMEALGETLLGVGDGAGALKIFNKLLKSNGENLSWWALKADALRLTGSEEYHWLYDYERLFFVRSIEPPSGYRNVDDFNEALLADLEKFHTGKQHPLDRSLRLGTQTVGNIFDVPLETIQQLESAMSEQILDCIERLPEDKSHPTLRNKSRLFDYIGSWSVRLRKEGFHANHNHPEGWFSGPYYVALPDIVKQEDNQQGYIRFGEPGYKALEPMSSGHIVAPKEGSLVLFPSYMWHGTVPFESEQYRVSVSQDLVQAPGG
ncbi:MAG: tetratricopeptide repeat protein [Halioglobus sp.]